MPQDLAQPPILCQGVPDGPRTAGPRPKGRDTVHKLTAQVAVEAIITDPGAYDRLVVLQVHEDAQQAGVSTFYLDAMVKVANIDQAEVRRFRS